MISSALVRARRLTDHEKRGCEVDADEVDAEVAAESEGRDGRQSGRHVAEKPQPRLAAHPIGHHAGDDREDSHDRERAGEVGHHRPRVRLQLELQRPGGEPRGAYVLEHSAVLGLAHGVEESLLPRGTAEETSND